MTKRGRLAASISVALALLTTACSDPNGSTPPSGATPDEDVQGCLDFEDRMLGDTFVSGDAIATSGAQLTVGDFTFSNGGTTSNGFSEVDDGGLAGGSGLELEVNNVVLSFDLGGSMEHLSFRFGEYGGNLNLLVNGDFRNIADFADVNGSNIGGVAVLVTNGLGNDRGTITLDGVIDSLSLGGQELWIDDVCIPTD